MISVATRHLALIICLLTTLALVACAESDSNSTSAPELLRIGLLPDEGHEALKKRFTPLAEYLSQNLQIPYELVIPDDYDDLVELFEKGQLDIAYFGGLTFLQAHQKADAIPLVMRDIDAHFTSYFLARSDQHVHHLSEMNGKRFSFGAQLSTSGHLMPRHFLNKKSIDPEIFFGEIKFSGAHDKTVFLIRDGIVDFGVANSEIIDAMYIDGRLNPDEIYVFWETPPFTDNVWAARADIDESFKNKLINHFLSLLPSNENHEAILNHLGAGGFIPANINDFSVLREVAYKSGLISQQDNH